MSTRRWLVACSPRMRDGVRDAIGEVCGTQEDIELDFLESASDLRQHVLLEPGVSVAVAPHASCDISDVNLAAAVVRDGYAAQVMLAREHVSGSLMSRARQAGIGLVAEIRAEGAFLYPLHGGLDVGGDQHLLPQDEGSPADETAVVQTALSARKQRKLEEGRAPIIVVASGRGGVGKTTLAALLALQARAWGMRVALVDVDLAQGNLRSLIGEGRQGVFIIDDAKLPSVDDLIAEAQSVDHDLLLLGPCDKPEDTDVAAPLISPLLDRLTQELDLVVVDTSNTVTDAVADAMQAADRLLLLSDDMPGGLASLARLSGLAVRLGVARARIVRVVNRCDPKQPLDLTSGRAEVGLEMARIYQLAEGGIDVAELAAEGALADVMKECRELASSVASCLARLLGELGRLPDTPEAHEALEGSRKRKLLPFLHRQREAS